VPNKPSSVTAHVQERMRLDKWLWAARFFKTRHLAVEAINGGKVHVNGQRAKPGKEIECGQKITLTKDIYTFDITVAALTAQRRPAGEAATLYLESHVPIEIVHHAQIELHFAVNRYFIKENEILHHIDRVAHLPTAIIHGRKDLVCPVESAWTLHKALPKSTLEILPEAGHIASTEDMIDALIKATDDMASLLAG